MHGSGVHSFGQPNGIYETKDERDAIVVEHNNNNNRMNRKNNATITIFIDIQKNTHTHIFEDGEIARRRQNKKEQIEMELERKYEVELWSSANGRSSLWCCILQHWQHQQPAHQLCRVWVN